MATVTLFAIFEALIRRKQAQITYSIHKHLEMWYLCAQ